MADVFDVKGAGIQVDAVENAPGPVAEAAVLGAPRPGLFGPRILGQLVGGLKEGVNSARVVLEVTGSGVESCRFPQNLPRSFTPPGGLKKGTPRLAVGYGGLGTVKGAVPLQAGESQGVLKVFEFGGRDEDRRRDSAIGQSDVLVLGGPASKIAEPASRFRDGIRRGHESSVHLHAHT